MLIFLPQEIAMNYKQLTQEERYQIEAYLKIGLQNKEIARHLGKYPSTIGREIKRNLGLRGYRPKQANQFAVDRRHKAQKSIKLTESIKEQIETLIRQELSPEQVCIYLEKNDIIKFHHETIYRMVLADKEKKGTLYQHLRHLHKSHRKGYGSYDRRGRIKMRRVLKNAPRSLMTKSALETGKAIPLLTKTEKEHSTLW
jgi:IS30 family transposase